jgi:hypothetical protein
MGAGAVARLNNESLSVCFHHSLPVSEGLPEWPWVLERGPRLPLILTPGPVGEGKVSFNGVPDRVESLLRLDAWEVQPLHAPTYQCLWAEVEWASLETLRHEISRANGGATVGYTTCEGGWESGLEHGQWLAHWLRGWAGEVGVEGVLWPEGRRLALQAYAPPGVEVR